MKCAEINGLIANIHDRIGHRKQDFRDMIYYSSVVILVKYQKQFFNKGFLISTCRYRSKLTHIKIPKKKTVCN